MVLKRETKLKAKLLFVAIPFAISGCAISPPQYKEPSGQSDASITFMNETPVPMEIYIHADATECTDRSSAGKIQANTLKTLRVFTDKALVFTVAVNLQNERNKTLGGLGVFGGALGALAVVAVTSPDVKDTKNVCIPTIDFLPEAGHNYVFKLNSDVNGCSYKFVDSPTQNQKFAEAIPVAFTTREWIRAWGESGPFCKRK